jgi:hypothetical protein
MSIKCKMHDAAWVLHITRYSGGATVGRRGSISDTGHFYRMQRSGMRLFCCSCYHGSWVMGCNFNYYNIINLIYIINNVYCIDVASVWINHLVVLLLKCGARTLEGKALKEEYQLKSSHNRQPPAATSSGISGAVMVECVTITNPVFESTHHRFRFPILLWKTWRETKKQSKSIIGDE